MKIFIRYLCVSTMMACASTPDISSVQIEGMVIENQTQIWISAARVLLPSTGGFVSCGGISPGAMCSTSFPETAYSGEPLEVTWSQAGQIHSTGQFEMQLPDEPDNERAATVRVVIAGAGSAGAIIVQPQQ